MYRSQPTSGPKAAAPEIELAEVRRVFDECEELGDARGLTAVLRVTYEQLDNRPPAPPIFVLVGIGVALAVLLAVFSHISRFSARGPQTGLAILFLVGYCYVAVLLRQKPNLAWDEERKLIVDWACKSVAKIQSQPGVRIGPLHPDTCNFVRKIARNHPAFRNTARELLAPGSKKAFEYDPFECDL